MRHCLVALIWLGTLFGARPTSAQTGLPYATRTLSFSGISTSVEGDIRTVGMAGAAAGLADTFIAAIDSPAGLAMTVRQGDIHFSGDSVTDGHVQDPSQEIHTSSFGLALSLYPWAVSAGYRSPYREEALYRLQSTPQDPAVLSVTTREIVLSAARVFANNRLSLGVTVLLGQAQRSLTLASGPDTGISYASYSAGATLGAMVRLPLRLLVSASVSSPIHYSAGGNDVQQNTSLPGFFQAVDVPWRAVLGVGFIPNRFARADFTLRILGGTDHAALLRDETALVGESITVQPHIGAAYVFADYKELKGTVFGGTYFESTRIRGTDGRLHGSAGIEGRVWIVTLGAGVDIADQYRNYLVSIGVDVFNLMARLQMIPTAQVPPYGRILPRPDFLSEEGLARPLVEHWDSAQPEVDPVKAGLELPDKIKPGIENARKAIEDFIDPKQEPPSPPPQ